MEILNSYSWPGNVREFSNILANMLLTCGWDKIKDTLSARDVQAEDKINTPVNIRDGINRNTLYKKIDMFQIEASPVARVFHSK